MSAKSPSGSPVATIPQEIYDKLREFSARTGIPVNHLTKIGLSRFVDKLLSGKAAIVNGEYVEGSFPASKAA